jgi:hypothetical protein|tara:strand:- start:490 stop:666 length:177 start_codon:yes stop_codon:yes gene_type:complete
MKKKKKYTMMEARTKEWDASVYQGRSKRQVENNYKVVGITIVSVLVVVLFYFIVGLFV